MLISPNELESQNLQEFEELLREYIKIKPTSFLEIGSLYGWTLQHFIHYSEVGSTGVSIDLPVRSFVGPHDPRVEKQEFYYKSVWPTWAKEKKCKLYLIKQASQDFEVLEKVRSIFNQQQIDFLFIDGNHTYSGVKQDYEMYGPLVKKGGLIAFHDIGKNEEGGVNCLWDEIKNNHSSYKEFLYEPNEQKGIGLIFV